MSIQEGYNQTEQYFAPMNKEARRVFIGTPREEYVDEYEPVFDSFEDEPVFDSFDNEDY